MAKPVLLLTFANDTAPFLEQLKAESRAIVNCLLDYSDKGYIQVEHAPYATLDEVSRFLQRYHDRLCIFHYGGHAKSRHLLFEQGRSQPHGFAGLLAAQKNLKLVFLNGCATEDLARLLLEQGVKAVIGTTLAVADEQAMVFSSTFYRGLTAGQTILEAYQHAVNFFRSQFENRDELSSRYTVFQRGVDTMEEAFEMSWQLLVNENHQEVLHWKIPQRNDHQKAIHPSIPKYLGNPPVAPELFIGREQDLRDVHRKLFQEENTLLLVNGNGGIGKTTLASKYFLQYKGLYKHLAWVFAGEDLLGAFLQLAIPLEVEFAEGINDEVRLQLVLDKLRTLEEPCLLVIDNANSLKELEDYYLALRSCPNFYLLITTRVTQFGRAPIHQIGPLSTEKAMELFKRHYPKHQEEEDSLLLDLFHAVDSNTLVIELLAKNLQNINGLKRRYSLVDMLNDLGGQGLLGLSQSKLIRTRYQARSIGVRKAKPEAIIAAMYELHDLTPEEVQILIVLSVLPAENIPFLLFEPLVSDLPNVADHLVTLFQKGWIDLNQVDQSFRINQVIQEVVRSKREDLLEDCRVLINQLIDLLDYQGSVGHLLNVTYEQAFIYVRYAESLLRHLSSFDVDLPILCERIGRFFSATGNLDQALEYYELDMQLSKELSDSDPSNVSFKNNLVIAYGKLGETYTSLGNLDQALEYYEEVTQLFEELYDAYPSNVEFKNNLAIAYEKLGNTYTSLGNLDQALKYYEGETQLFEELSDADPSNVSFKNGLAIAYSKLGETYTSLGNLDQALEYYERYYKLRQELYDAYPSNVSFKNGLAIAYSKLGNTYTSLGNLDQALEYYELDMQLSKELYDAYPSNVSFKNGLAIAYEKLGNTYTSLGNLDQALKYYELDMQLSKELYDAYPSNVSFKNGLAIAYSKLGETYTSLGNLDQALEYYERYYKFRQELYDAYPSNVSFKNGLAIAYWKLGDFYRQKNTAKAQYYFQAAEAHWETLATQFPAYVQFSRYLDIVRRDLNNL